MRIRQVKPDYWRDELVASLPDSVSRFYIGMWQEADDAGWLRWNIPEIALDLYGYQPRAKRERWVAERGAALAAVGRLVIHDCGHAFVPTLTKHQRFGGRQVYSIRDAHARDCARSIADVRPYGSSARPVKEREREKERGGTGGNGTPSKEDQLKSAREAIAKHKSGEQPLHPAALHAFETLIERYGP